MSLRVISSPTESLCCVVSMTCRAMVPWQIALADVTTMGGAALGSINFAKVVILWWEVSLSVDVLSNGRLSLSPNLVGLISPSVHAKIRSVSLMDCSAVGQMISIGAFKSCQSVERRNGTPSSMIWARTRCFLSFNESATC